VHHHPVGKQGLIEIATWKSDLISMDFVMSLPLSTLKRNALWVVVDRVTKSAHFLPIRVT